LDLDEGIENMTLSENFESRLPKSASDASKHNLRAVFSIADSFKQKADAIRSDHRSSDTGKDEELAKLRNETLQNGHFQQIRSQSVKAQERLKNEREALRATALKPNTDDVRAEMRAAEIRGMLRGLPEGERIRLAMSDDPEIRDAVAFAPSALSGVPQDIHGKILDAIVETKNQTRNSELAERETEIEIIAAAVAVAEGSIARG
jgi:hypothetical protein